MDRALGQVDASSELEADRQVAQLLQNTALGSSAAAAPSSFVSRLYEHLRMHAGSTVTERSCWFTLMSESQLAAAGDVLCLGAYIPPGGRNLPLCSVSSALVLQRLVLRGDIIVCPMPMSFLALRGILKGGRQIARGPHGHPINTVLCLLPTPGDTLSERISSTYQALAASQLLTTRWIYTKVSCCDHTMLLFLFLY